MNILKQLIKHIAIMLAVAAASAGAAAQTITYFHSDISGSPMLATDAAGNVLWKESYRPYGEKLNNQPASSINKIGYHGKSYDASTGLSYMGARYYAPALGRFTGVDPVDFQEGNLHSFNRYAYANNNPYKYVDPDGRYADLAVEAFSITLGLHSLRQNFGAGKYGAAAVDGLGVFGDTLLAAVPGVPGVFGLGIKGAREFGELTAKGAGQAAALRSQLIGKEIAGGHAFAKHVLQQGEFKGLGIRTREQFASHIENVINAPSSVRYYKDGRTVYLQESSSTVVIRNGVSGEGTAFQPRNWAEYISTLPSRTAPY